MSAPGAKPGAGRAKVVAMRGARAGVLALSALLALPARGADIALTEAWMRPALAGQARAAIYVDIRSDAALALVSARASSARRAELVENRTGDPADDRVVPSLPVAAGATTRLALRGSYIRLLDIVEPVPGGTEMPLELVFRDAAGSETTARTMVRVRGIAPRPAPGAPALSPPG